MFAAARLGLRRQATSATRRFASSSSSASSSSTSSSAANTAQQAASSAEQQAKQFSENVGKYYDQAVGQAKRVAGPVGDRLGGLLGGYREPLVYNFKVFTSLCRQVYMAEKLAPPTQLSTWVGAYARIWSRATNFGWWRETVKTGEWVKVGIYGLEAYGLFKIGEILGRRNLVGYKLKDNHAASESH